jgi:L-seryl-tRNA(Ser) seleniumtransferase
MTTELDRRTFVGLATAAGLSQLADSSPAAPSPGRIAADLKDNIYTRLLGVRPHLGAHEHISRLSSSRMPSEVIEAMRQANEYFVEMNELIAAAGAHIARGLGAEDALITTGGFSSMVLGAAGCLTGTDPARIEALPHPTWERREVLIPKGHRFDYDRAYRLAGATLVAAEDRADFTAKLGPRTAMVGILACAEKQAIFAPPFPVTRNKPPGPEVMKLEEAVELAHQAGVPVLLDMASDLPPHTNPRRFLEMGADLIAISGGKGIMGPQATGILAGRKDLIAAARLNHYPNDQLGRGMKLGKESVIGLVVAFDRYLKLDHPAMIAGWNRKAEWLAAELQGIPGLTAVAVLNTMGYQDVDLSWDQKVIPVTVDAAKAALRDGEPRVVYDLALRTRQLRDGEEALVAKRVREYFLGVARGKAG